MFRTVLKPLTVLMGIFLAGIAVLFTWLSAINSPQYAWRVIVYGDSDPQDYLIFPQRAVHNGGHMSIIKTADANIPQTVTFPYDGTQHTEAFDDLLHRTNTGAFIIIRDDKVVYEAYLDSTRASIHTSFSVAKSFDSALIGAAIADGRIGSVDDAVIKYIPELTGRGIDILTIRNLLQMDSGIRYRHNEELPFYIHPFGDDSFSYYSADLRKIALSVQPSETPIGEAFRYNNYHPLLEGLILERVTGMHVAEYLQEKIWSPMGAEYPASWSLDSASSGFEKMESGINASAMDFARFGLIFLHKGNWNGRQILPEAWVTESTTPLDPDPRVWETFPEWLNYGGYYKYHWWGLKNPDGVNDFAARGHLGQVIYVAPRKNMVVVRFGDEPDSNINWTLVIHALVDQMP
jgi:CubicO group peptidase (beta-lactamase class C family)